MQNNPVLILLLPPLLQDVEELARQRLKVQLENLCQFLPQDKVGVAEGLAGGKWK